MKMEEIACFEKNKTETVKICLQEYKGFEVIDIRIWSRIGGDKEYVTKKGLTIRRELLPELISTLEKALE